MADIVDRAQAREFELLEEARARVAAAMHRGPSREYCAECTDRIPTGRMRAVPGCQLCIGCQEFFEKRNARRG